MNRLPRSFVLLIVVFSAILAFAGQAHATPNISSLSPTSGAVGTSVTITGTGFGATQSTSTVTFNGATATPTSWSSTSIVVPVPSAATPGSVIVTVSGTASNAVTFTVTPTISSISPTSGWANSFVTITGTGFGATIGTSTVTFNTVASPPTSWSQTTIVVPVPSNATTGSVVVTVGGSASSGVTFTLVTTGTISGYVTNASGGAAVSGASVFVKQSGTVDGTATTASDGSYSVSGLTPGLYEVMVSASGFETAIQSTSLSWTPSAAVNVALNAPTIASLVPTSGPVGTPITITGSNFGSAQGPSSVSFNGVLGSPTSWSSSSVVVPVPSGATTGSVVVMVAGVNSNDSTFTVGAGTFTGAVTRSSDGAALTGALIEILQSNSVITSTSSTSGGAYSIGSLPAGTYDIRISDSGYATSLQTSKSVTAGGSTTVNAALATPGTISGTVTITGGSTPIVGASVTTIQSADTVSTATTDGSGNYSIANLTAGTYSVQVTASGYLGTTQTGVSVTASTTTTENISLAGQSVITYSYDAAGRLTGTVDSQGDAVAYSYDPVGNLGSITRNASTSISVSGFTPPSAPVGATVTINGTAFSTTTSLDTVKFDGTTATISSATATQIVAAVPAGAATGTISVTSPAGTATSAASFTVTSSSGAPTISGFSPSIGVAGTAVTITGTNFNTTPANDSTLFNVTPGYVGSATSTSISENVPLGATSGHIKVSTVSGEATTSSYIYVAPSPYTASNVDYTGSMTIGGSTTASLSTSGEIGLVVFDATAGQRVSLAISQSMSGWTTESIIDPNGATLVSSTITSSSGYIGLQTLPVNGTYTILLVPLGTATGTVSLTLNGVTSDVLGTIGYGTATTVTITAPGQNACLTFSGTAGHRVSLLISQSTSNWTDEYIVNPDGSTLGMTTVTGSGGFIDVQTLAVNGVYKVLANPESGGTGTITLTLYDVPADITGAIPIDVGATTTMTNTTPGQNGNYTFVGVAGETVELLATPTMSDLTVLSIINPDNSTLASTVLSTTIFGYIPLQTLPANGTYTVRVDPEAAGTGSVALTLGGGNAQVLVPNAYLGELGSFTTTGQSEYMPFSANSGQELNFQTLADPAFDPCYLTVTILNPDFTTLYTNSCIDNNWSGGVGLSQSGTYTIELTSTGTATGAWVASMALFNGSTLPPSRPTGKTLDTSSPLSTNLAGLFIMNEATGTTDTNLVDSNTASFAGSTLPTWNTSDPSVVFAGGGVLNSYMDAGTDLTFDDLTPNQMTIVAKVFITSGASTVGLAEKNDGDTIDSGFVFGIYSGLFLFDVEKSVSDMLVYSNDNYVPTGEWVQLAATWDGTVGTAAAAHIFLNGTELTKFGYTDGSGTIGYLNATSQPFHIGDEFFDGSLNGKMAYLAVYKGRILTPAEMGALDSALPIH